MDYNAVTAKIKALRSRLLTEADYYALCNSQSVSHFLNQAPLSRLEDELAKMRLFIGDIQNRRLLLLEQNERDQNYIKNWSFIKSMPNSQNRKALMYIKGSEIDLHNIMRIYRLKRYYPKAEIYPNLIPICLRLSKEEIKQMSDSPGVGEFIVAVRHTPYKHLSFENPEHAVFKDMKRIYNRLVKRCPQSAVGILSYFFDKRTEEYNLQAIEEGLRNHLPPGEILGYLRL